MLKVARFILSGVVFFGGSLILGLLVFVRPFNPKMALLWARWIPPVGLKMLNLKVEIRNRDRMKDNHPCVYISNHQHALDLFVHASSLTSPTVAIGKREVKWIPLFGWVFWLTGMVFINRQHRGSAMESMRDATKAILEKGYSVWMFVEGTRSRGKGLLPFKKGAFHLAIQAQVPILPIATSQYHRTLNFNHWNPGRVILDVMEPIPTSGMTASDVDNLIQMAHSLMKSRIEELDLEILQTAQ